MDQNLIRIIKISTLKFMPSTGTLTWFFIALRDLLEFWMVKGRGFARNLYWYGRLLFMNILLKFCV